MSYLFKACIFIGVAIVAAELTLPNTAPAFASITAAFAGVQTSFADITASLVDNLRLRPRADRSTPIPQSTADVQALPPAVERSAGTTAITASPAEGHTEAENVEPQSDAILSQFQAWAAAQANVAPSQVAKDEPAQVVQSGPTRFAEDTKAPNVPVKKLRPRVTHNARPKLPLRRSLRNPQQPLQNAQAQIPPSLSAESQ